MAKDQVRTVLSSGVRAVITSSDNVEAWTTDTDGVTVGKAVYLDAANHIVHADANVASAVGVAFEKTDSTNMRTQTWGIQEGVLTSATTGKAYYLSETAGALTATEPTTVGAFSHILGRAVNTTDLFLCPETAPRKHVAQPAPATPKAVSWDGANGWWEVYDAVVVPKAWATWPGVAIAPKTAHNSSVIVTLAANLGSDHGQPDRGDPQLVVFSQEAPVIYGPFTANGGTTNSTTLHSGAPAFAAQSQAERRVRIVGGTGAGQERSIRGDHPADKATVTYAFSPAPDATSTFEIYEDRLVRMWHEGGWARHHSGYGGMKLTTVAGSAFRFGDGTPGESGVVQVASGSTGYTAALQVGLGDLPDTFTRAWALRTDAWAAQVLQELGSNAGGALLLSSWNSDHGHGSYTYPTHIIHGVNPATDNTAWLGAQYDGGNSYGRLFTGKGGVKLDPYDGKVMLPGVQAALSAVKTTTYQALDSDCFVRCDSTGGAFTVTLPAATNNSGKFIIVKDVTGQAGTNNVSIAPNGAETIDGSAAAVTLASAYALRRFFSDGSNWFTW